MWRHGTLRGVFRPNTETPRKLRFAGDVVGRGCTGDDTHAPGFCVCVSARPTVSPGGRMGRGERREAHTPGWATHLASQLKLDRPSRCERPWPGKAHEGGAALTFSVVVVYFGCCLVAADASLCVHLSSVSVRQFSRVFVPESRASEPISLQVDACVWYPTITGGFLSKVLFNCTGC